MPLPELLVGTVLFAAKVGPGNSSSSASHAGRLLEGDWRLLSLMPDEVCLDRCVDWLLPLS